MLVSCEDRHIRAYTYLFLNLNISCSGNLKNWTVAGRLSLISVTSNPSLLVWRVNPNNPSEYHILHRTSLLMCHNQTVAPNRNGLYSCELTEGLPVQEGDTVGLEIPFYEYPTTQFVPYFTVLSNSMPTLRYSGTSLFNFVESRSNSLINRLPLLSVNVELEGKKKTSLVYQCHDGYKFSTGRHLDYDS